MFKFITSKPLWVNILVALGVLLIVVLLFFSMLGWITNHGKNQEVPNVVGQNIVAATKILKDKGFDVEVQDSVFIDSVGRLAVTKQSPDPNTNVKAGRTIYLTINRAIPPEVDMPNLSGFSFKSAQYMLQTLNLKVADTIYKECEGPNTILEVLFNGKPIKEGTKLPMGSSISFVLCRGLGNTEVQVPELYGFTVEQAISYLKSNNLNQGVINARGTAIADTMKAFVIEQTPAPFTVDATGASTANRVRKGQTIDLVISATAPAPKTSTTDTTGKPATNP